MDGNLKKLRACMVCGVLQTLEGFAVDGCPNCEEFLALRGSNDRILDSTSSSYSGCISLVQPRSSWVARVQGLAGRKAGLYAIRVTGRLPEDVEDICAARGIRAAIDK